MAPPSSLLSSPLASPPGGNDPPRPPIITQASAATASSKASPPRRDDNHDGDDGGDDRRADDDDPRRRDDDDDDGGGSPTRTAKKPRFLDRPSPVRVALLSQQVSHDNTTKNSHHPRQFLVLHKSSRRTNDEIHSTIRLCPVTCLIMDTPEFQRLKGIKQLGSADFVYMNCNTTRFEHSVGVSELARRLVTHLCERQPQLGLTTKDVLCVKLAGLLHDVGHGPFSHVYEQFQEYLTSHLTEAEMEGRSDMDRSATRRDGSYADTIHPLDVPYRGHESVSLRVIVHIFERTLGLPLNWTDLDAPLLLLPSRPGNALPPSASAKKSGGTATIAPHLDSDEDDEDDHDHEGGYRLVVPSSSIPSPRPDDDDDNAAAALTTRDVLFIMECIWGKPIDHYETMLGPGFHGRPPHKEWLYDVVCNRHSGLDVDKIDYYARDERRAFRGAGEIDQPMIEEAVVAWAECVHPESCHKCKYRTASASRQKGNNSPRHLMICYPRKHVATCIDFFQKRFELHTKIYSHKTSVGTAFLICDILRSADPYFRLPVLRSDPGSAVTVSAAAAGSAKREYAGLPISRAFVDPDVFLRCRDSVLDQIASTTDPNLAEARRLIARLWSRDIYKCAVFMVLDMRTERSLWELSEKEIVDGMLQVRGVHRDESTGKELALTRGDILVHKCNIHHGSKDSNPLLQMRFVEKHQLHKLAWPLELLPEATPVQVSRYEARLPRQFAERSLRIYSRDSAKEPLVRHVFEQWYAEFLGEMELTPCGMDASASAFGVNPEAQHVAFFCSQDSNDNNNDEYSDDDNETAGRGGLDQSPAPPRRSPRGNGGGLGQVTPVRRF